MAFLRHLCWDHSCSGKTWEKSQIASKDAERRTCNITLLVWGTWGETSAQISFFVCSVSFNISEIPATGCCNNCQTKWPLTHQSCLSESIRKHMVFYLCSVWSVFLIHCDLEAQALSHQSSSRRFPCFALVSLTLFPLPDSHTLHFWGSIFLLSAAFIHSKMQNKYLNGKGKKKKVIFYDRGKEIFTCWELNRSFQTHLTSLPLTQTLVLPRNNAKCVCTDRCIKRWWVM